MERRASAVARVCFIAAVFPTPLAASPIGSPAAGPLRLELDSGGPGAQWALAVSAGRPEVELLREGGEEALELRSRASSFGLQRRVGVDLAERPHLAWRWRAYVLPEGGDFRSAGTDDQAAQVYVAFSPSRAIGYLWDSNAPAGLEGDCAIAPFFMKVKMVVLRSGPEGLGEWHEERRDLREDYERLFGERLPEVRALGIRLWINSQHTGSSAASAIGGLRFD